MTPIPAGWKPRLACPFCGSNCLFTEPDEYGSGGQWVSPIHVGCNDCKAEQSADTEDAAVDRWNRRSSPASVAPGDAQDERQVFEAWSKRANQGYDLTPNVSGRMATYESNTTEHAYRGFFHGMNAPAAGDALDARRYRWLRDQTETDGIAIVMKDKHFDESSTCAENIDKFIDAALAAQVPQQGEA